MDLYEHQAKQLFGDHDVALAQRQLASTPEQARLAAERIGGRVVVKAQVKVGGRGKAGGVKVADGAADAAAKAEQILGMDIKGHTVRRVLVEEASDIAEEYYFSVLLDRANRTFLSICSAEGGVEIEEVAETDPEAVAKIAIDPLTGVPADLAARIVEQGKLPEAAAAGAASLITKLWDCFVGKDATLVEVNPLILTSDGRVVALDGKVTLDESADFRQDLASLAVAAEGDSREVWAREKGLNYVKLAGEVGVIGNGAGLVMSTLDVVAYAGESRGGVSPANFLDIGGGASAQVMADGLEVVLGDPGVRSVFVNVFGGITACDAVAQGIVDALGMLAGRGDDVSKPLVVRLDGNSARAGRAILEGAAHPAVSQVQTMDGAAARAAELAAESAGK